MPTRVHFGMVSKELSDNPLKTCPYLWCWLSEGNWIVQQLSVDRNPGLQARISKTVLDNPNVLDEYNHMAFCSLTSNGPPHFPCITAYCHACKYILVIHAAIATSHAIQIHLLPSNMRNNVLHEVSKR